MSGNMNEFKTFLEIPFKKVAYGGIYKWSCRNTCDLRNYLTDEEILGALRFHNERRKNEYERGRFLLKSLLLKNLFSGWGLSFKDISIIQRENGKPFISSRYKEIFDSVLVSISHREDYYFIIYVSRFLASSLGCDIETFEEKDSSFIEDFFTEKEKKYIEKQRGDNRLKTISFIWSAKEACLKGTGTGLCIDTRKIEIIPLFFDGEKLTAKGKIDEKEFEIEGIVFENALATCAIAF